MIGIPLGLAFANASEWLIHKHWLHGRGKRKESFWSFHWHDHHRASRKYGHIDPDYRASVLQWNGQGKEALLLTASSALSLPLLPIAPFFVGTLVYSSINYYRKHKRAHLDPDWARAHLPWHYDHHMGPDQNANWCVTHPWFDKVMGTRKPYVGTAKERADRQRQRARAAAAPSSLEHERQGRATVRAAGVDQRPPQAATTAAQRAVTTTAA